MGTASPPITTAAAKITSAKVMKPPPLPIAAKVTAPIVQPASATPHSPRSKQKPKPEIKLTQLEKKFLFPAVNFELMTSAEKQVQEANAKYGKHPIIVTKNTGKKISFTYFSETDKPKGEAMSQKKKIDEKFTTLDGSKNGRYKRRRLGWKPSHDIPRRREGFHHLFSRIIRE